MGLFFVAQSRAEPSLWGRDAVGGKHMRGFRLESGQTTKGPLGDVLRMVGVEKLDLWRGRRGTPSFGLVDPALLLEKGYVKWGGSAERRLDSWIISSMSGLFSGHKKRCTDGLPNPLRLLNPSPFRPKEARKSNFT